MGDWEKRGGRWEKRGWEAGFPRWREAGEIGKKYAALGAVSSIFSITVRSQKTHFYLWKPKNNGPVVLKRGVPVHGNYNKYVWRGMARMEMVCNFWQNFSSFCLMSQIKYLKTNFGLFFLLKIHLILSPCGLKAIHV